jgi:hypoxanthine-guanine phosphoribosyltransferase
MRRLTMPVELEFVRAASRGSSTTALRGITITKDIDTDIKGRHVLLVDGIIDSGDPGLSAKALCSAGSREPQGRRSSG